ncbi:hypothetical protein AMATHDRAFT_61444 [Amanita thiersii Skay4041]|uniref:Uncharacterized protein n=1 Tax=Amanita thiersii Skay4041 TaxID=703135 RepID=A0A2A9NLP0_9AGAR|nr:hypothetical protein AMATHDRAFT_61444 [Amanita thiersii Skay4041]
MWASSCAKWLEEAVPNPCYSVTRGLTHSNIKHTFVYHLFGGTWYLLAANSGQVSFICGYYLTESAQLPRWTTSLVCKDIFLPCEPKSKKRDTLIGLSGALR